MRRKGRNRQMGDPRIAQIPPEKLGVIEPRWGMSRTVLTELERRVLHCVASASQPVDTAMRCAELCGIAMSDARRTLDSLRASALIEWVVPLRELDVDLVPARWELTEAGRQELAQT